VSPFKNLKQGEEIMKKPPVPKLPKSIKELRNLLKKEFKILWTSEPISAATGGKYHPGETALIITKKECPFCGMQFGVSIRSGCFGSTEIPATCPNCNFPLNAARALIRKIRKTKK